MSNSSLVNYIKLSPNHSGQRKHAIDTITIHHMAGNLSVETCGNIFQDPNRQASSNYGIDSTGRVGMYVEEHNRSWCSSSASNDNRAITIEVANDEYGGNWHVSDLALNKTIELCVDICRRNGIKRLNYTGDTTGNLTKHEWFAPTNCPGPYLGSKFPYIADEVNKRLNGVSSISGSSVLYRVRKSWDYEKSQKGAFNNLENAKVCANENKGYFVYDEKGNQVYPEQKVNASSLEDIARQVIDGKWGNGEDRIQSLTSAGYNYYKVQEKVNELVNGMASQMLKSVEEIAQEVIQGKWGNGQDRVNRLTNVGYNYNEVQQKVNEILG